MVRIGKYLRRFEIEGSRGTRELVERKSRLEVLGARQVDGLTPKASANCFWSNPRAVRSCPTMRATSSEYLATF